MCKQTHDEVIERNIRNACDHVRSWTEEREGCTWAHMGGGIYRLRGDDGVWGREDEGDEAMSFSLTSYPKGCPPDGDPAEYGDGEYVPGKVIR